MWVKKITFRKLNILTGRNLNKEDAKYSNQNISHSLYSKIIKRVEVMKKVNT